MVDLLTRRRIFKWIKDLRNTDFFLPVSGLEERTRYRRSQKTDVCRSVDEFVLLSFCSASYFFRAVSSSSSTEYGRWIFSATSVFRSMWYGPYPYYFAEPPFVKILDISWIRMSCCSMSTYYVKETQKNYKDVYMYLKIAFLTIFSRSELNLKSCKIRQQIAYMTVIKHNLKFF